MRRVDVEAALDNGADAVGFIVGTPTARRNLQLETARRLMKNVPILASKIAVTTSLNLKLLERIYKTLTPDALQLHKYDENTVRMLRRKNPELKIIISTPIRDHRSIFEAEQAAKSSDAIHADTASHVVSGGTGKTHDWKLSAQLRKRIYPHPLILAGGLNATNVRLAIRTVRPYAVDVSSGVETTIGVKDHHEMKMFIKNAKEDAT
jgi:phosphoribosylanthranilate isomerase